MRVVYAIKIFSVDKRGKDVVKWYHTMDEFGIRMYDKLSTAKQVCTNLRYWKNKDCDTPTDIRIYALNYDDSLKFGEEVDY